MKKTLKTKVMNYVEIKGSATHKEIKNFMMREQHGRNMTHADRGKYSSYFSGEAIARSPSKREPRYLVKNARGKYVVQCRQMSLFPL